MHLENEGSLYTKLFCIYQLCIYIKNHNKPNTIGKIISSLTGLNKPEVVWKKVLFNGFWWALWILRILIFIQGIFDLI